METALLSRENWMELERHILKEIEIRLREHWANYGDSSFSDRLVTRVAAYVHEFPGAHLGTATQSCALIFDATVQQTLGGDCECRG